MTKLAYVGVAEAKKSLSELLGKVAYGRQSFTIVKRGRPMARLVPASKESRRSLGDVKGWMEDEDPFQQIMDEIVAARHSHHPRRVGLVKK